VSTSKRRTVADVAVGVAFGVPFPGDAGCVGLVEYWVEDRLPVQARRDAPPVAGGNQVEFGRIGIPTSVVQIDEECEGCPCGPLVAIGQRVVTS